MNISIKTKKDKPVDVLNFYSKDALTTIIKNARKICGNSPLACNILICNVMIMEEL